LEKEAFPLLPGRLECAVLARAGTYVVDYDDAWFDRYREHAHPVIRAVLKDKIAHVIQQADTVIVGSAYLQAYASRHARRVELLPTVVDLAQYPAEPKERRPGAFAIGWIGSPSTVAYLERFRDLLARFCREREARLVVIGGSEGESWFDRMEVVPWSEEGEGRALSDIDVGVMPLDDTAFARGKCGLKAIQYMASWKPVVASPVGEAAQVVQDGVTGILATSPEAWWTALAGLQEKPDLCLAMGRAGRARVEQRYSLTVAVPRLIEILFSAAPRERND
jgi:glycosyltransferase involved in cell wall biosynthesis